MQGWTAAYAAAARSHINNGEECLSFDPDADAAAGSTIALTSGVTIIDDDNVGNAKTVKLCRVPGSASTSRSEATSRSGQRRSPAGAWSPSLQPRRLRRRDRRYLAPARASAVGKVRRERSLDRQGRQHRAPGVARRGDPEARALAADTGPRMTGIYCHHVRSGSYFIFKAAADHGMLWQSQGHDEVMCTMAVHQPHTT